MGVRLSERRIFALKPESRRYDLWDADTPGLIVNVTPTGHRAYMVCRRMPGKWNPTRRLIAEVGAVELREARNIASEWECYDPGRN